MNSTPTIDRANSEFWDELCGTQLASSLGVTDASPDSLARFDRYYFGLYPYVAKRICAAHFQNHDVLEIGLGYGSVSERLAKVGARYTGLDIAFGPLAMVRHRLEQNNLSGRVLRASVLSSPFEDESFDAVVSIGCIHHTGNLPRALTEIHRILRPGGQAFLMVYNAFSYRRWLRWPRSTARRMAREAFAKQGQFDAASSTEERAAYDMDTDGNAAPETVFTSARGFRALTNDWSAVDVWTENAARELVFRLIPRRVLLRTVGRVAGLDLYCWLRK
jgi:SAM-dependent methyltransferase